MKTSEEAVHDAVRRGQEFSGLLAGNETAVRYAIVDPILWSLGWRTWLPSECQPDFALGRYHRADYALFDGSGEAMVFIQVRPMTVRRQRDRDRLRETVRRITQGVAVLTCGWEWEIYDLARRDRAFAGRRVERLILDLDAPNNQARVADALYQWLGKDRWW